MCNINNILQNYKYISTKSSQGNDKTINDGDMKFGSLLYFIFLIIIFKALDKMISLFIYNRTNVHHFESFTVTTRTSSRTICAIHDHVYVPLVVITIWSFPNFCLITGFVTKVNRRLPLVEQEVLTLLVHLNSPPTCWFLLLNL